MHVHTAIDPLGVGVLQEMAPFARVINQLGGVMVKRQLHSLLVQLGAQLVNVFGLGVKLFIGLSGLAWFGTRVGDDHARPMRFEQPRQLHHLLD